MTGRIAINLCGLLAGAALAGAAAAQDGSGDDDAYARAVWDRFAHDCRAVVDAVEPIVYTAGLYDEGGAGRSEDGLIGSASGSIQALMDGGEHAILLASVNGFREGRVVQCVLQIVRSTRRLGAIADIAREEAAAILGAPVAEAGGPVSEIGPLGLLGPDGDGETPQMLRFATEGFPPRAVISIQLLPQIAFLVLNVAQPNDAE
ncbi:MAG: hypothetical protein R3F55_08905 [Alphaproteobacteria bacterium]